MGVLDWQQDEGTGDVTARAQGPVDTTGFFENVGAGYREAISGPGSTRNRQNAVEARYYDSIIQALNAEGEMGEDKIAVRPGGFGYRGPKDIPVNQYGVGFVGKKRAFRNPYKDAPSLSQGDNPIARFYLGGDRTEASAIWEAVKRVRARKPDFLKDLPDETALTERANKDRQSKFIAAQTITSKAGALGKAGQFIGNIAGSFVAGDPENFIGGGSGVAGKTIARTIIKRGLTEGAVNVVAGTVALPGQDADQTEHLGMEHMTAKQAGRSLLEQFALGAVIGGTVEATPHVAKKGKELAGKAVSAAVENAPAPVRDAIAAASLRAGTVKDRSLLSEWRKLHNPYSVVGDTSTPDERAAAHVTERDVEVREASPLNPAAADHNEHRMDAIASHLGVSLKAPDMPSAAPVQTPTVRDRTGESPRRAASYVEGIGHAEGTARNPRSSAVGGGQFIDSTWLAVAPKITNTEGMSRAQILGLRSSKALTDKAIEYYGNENGRYLRARGLEDSPGNKSLAHFLGPDGAAKVLKADPATPVERILPREVITANREVLKGKSASEVVAWAHRRIGATVDGPVARPDSVPEFDPLDDIEYADVRPYGAETFTPDQVETDAGLMQYKSGGDEAGVTEKLKNVTAWNPIVSSEILVWQTKDGRNIVVDGHQRTGLAKRLFPEDPSIRLPAIIVREADGITAKQARVLGALRNISLGTGSLLDNARVLRDAPNGGRMIEGAEHRRDIEGLANLSHEAFGAVVNGVLDPRIAARIGNVAGDAPDTHMSMADLLLKSKIHNPAEAETIVRQARADGFGTDDAANQLAMFGDAPAQSLYVPIARILAAAEKRLREDKRTFKVLSDRAAKIEGAGNVLDRAANQEKVIGSDEALAILNATAHSSGPVRDALIAAARAELSGARRGDAVNRFLDELGTIDLRAAAAGVGRHDGAGAALGRAGSEDALASADGELPASLEPSLFDQAVATAQKAEVFSDPVGEGAKAQTAMLEHDLLMDAVKERSNSLQRTASWVIREKETGAVIMETFDPKAVAALNTAKYEAVPIGEYLGSINGKTPTDAPSLDLGAQADPAVAARQKQQTQLKAEAPMRSVEDQQGTIGLGLFDVADQPTFRMSEEGDARPIHDIMKEAEADELAAQAAAACLQPPKVTE